MPGQIVKRGKSPWLVRIYLGRGDGGKRRFSTARSAASAAVSTSPGIHGRQGPPWRGQTWITCPFSAAARSSRVSGIRAPVA